MTKLLTALIAAGFAATAFAQGAAPAPATTTTAPPAATAPKAESKSTTTTKETTSVAGVTKSTKHKTEKAAPEKAPAK